MKVIVHTILLIVQVALEFGTAQYLHRGEQNGKKLKVQSLQLNGGATNKLPISSVAHPGAAPGDLVSGALVTHWDSKEALSLQPSHRYRLDWLIRIKGAKNYVERSRVSPVFFTPAIGHLELSALPVNGNNFSLTEPESAQFDKEVVDSHNVDNSLGSAHLHGSWCLRRRCNRGAHGEVWRATRTSANSAESIDGDVFVLKRMLLEKGEHVRRAGLREVYFNEILRNNVGLQGRIARFVEAFLTTNSLGQEELWLVFVDEGMSLHQWMYTPSRDVVQGGAVLLEPSEGWKLLRTSSFGRSQLQELLRQIFQGLAALHASNITHRDIKSSNVLWGLWDPDSSTNPSSSSQLKVNMIDFSSAYDSESLRRGLFGPMGPTSDEETLEAMPPERIFSDMYSEDSSTTFDDRSEKADLLVPSPTADIWSAGVLFLEILLATRAVFTVDQRTRALLTWKLRHEPDEKLERVLFVAALADFCITTPNLNTANGDNRHSRRKPSGCSNRDVLAALHRRDPLELGFYSLLGVDGIDLLRKILKWKPEDRLTASQALEHPFLKLKSIGPGSEGENCLPAPETIDTNSAASNHQPIRSCKFALLAAPDDSSQSFTHTDKFDVGPYVCPGCGRSFDLYNSCLRHAVTRGHGLWCNPSYHSSAVETSSPGIPAGALTDPTTVPACNLPPCLSTHAQLHSDSSSGWCDAQGRRQYLEDHTAIVYATNYSLWSVYDGHLGASASQFVAHFLPPTLIQEMNAKQPTIEQVRRAFFETDAALLREQNTDALPSSSVHSLRKTEVVESQSPANFSLMRQILYPSSQRSSGLPAKTVTHGSATKLSALTEKASKGSIPPHAGTTATVALLTRGGILVVANVGDSRAVLCCGGSGQAVPLTVDHTASNPEEKARIEALGGTITFGDDHSVKLKAGNTARVNGEIVVTRSFGDGHIKKLLTAEPHVTILDMNAIKASEYHGIGINDEDLKEGLVFDFLVLASDGLWDVMSNDEAVEYVKARQKKQESWQAIATALTHEALLRGSLDNIGVCVVNLIERRLDE